MGAETEKNIAKNSGVLSIGTIISKIIGFIYGALVTAIILDEGNGYYGVACNAYAIILMISSLSIPKALSMIMSGKMAEGEYRNAHQYFKSSLVYVAIVGMIGSLVLFFGADFLAAGRSATVLRFFAPTVFAYGFLGVLRGYFQTKKNMTPKAVSDIIEQFANAIVSVGAAYVLTRSVGDADPTRRATFGAIGSVLGTGAGVLVTLLVMYFIYYRPDKKKIAEQLANDHHDNLPKREIYKDIFSILTPIILSTAINNLAPFTNSSLFSRILMNVKGMDEVDVVSMYGIFSRKAVVLAQLPLFLATSTASAMLPHLARYKTTNNYEKAGETISKISQSILLIAIPCAVGLAVLSRPIMMILFPQKVSLAEASMQLSILAITVVFFSLSGISSTALQGIKRIYAPVLNAVIALLLQTVVLVLLLLFTDMTGTALCIAMILFSLSTCVMNAISLRKRVPMTIDTKKAYVLPAISALVMGAVAVGTYWLISFVLSKLLNSDYFVNLVAAVVSILVGALVYLVLLFRTGGAGWEDLKMIPKGESIYRILKKLHIAR